MSDPEAKRRMFLIAAGYEGLAEHAAARRKREKETSSPLYPPGRGVGDTPRLSGS
jgi:hypothetical protein